MRRTLPVLYIAFILLMVALADTGTIGFFVRWIHGIPYGDKACHALFALGLGLAVDHRFGRDWHWTREGRDGKPISLTLRSTPFWLCPIVLLEECTQRFIPGRTFDLGDLLADAIGLTLGFVMSSILRHRCDAPHAATS